MLLVLSGCVTQTKVIDLREKGLTNLESTIKTRLAAIKPNNYGYRLGVRIVLPSGYHTFNDTLDLTSFKNLEIVGEGYCQLTFRNRDIGINLTGADSCYLSNLIIEGSPDYLVLTARDANLRSSGSHTFERCRFQSESKIATFANMASELNTFNQCNFVNYGDGVALLINNGLEHYSTMQTAWFENCQFGYSKNLIHIIKAPGNTISEIIFNNCYYSSSVGIPIILNAGNSSGLLETVAFYGSRAELEGCDAAIKIVSSGNVAAHAISIVGGQWGMNGPLILSDVILHSLFVNNVKLYSNGWNLKVPEAYILAPNYINPDIRVWPIGRKSHDLYIMPYGR